MKGHEIRFHRESVATMSDAVVTGLVAHELAHVLQWSDSDGSLCDDPDDEELNEEDADRLCDSWGIDLTPLDKWKVKNVDPQAAQDVGSPTWRRH